MRRQKPRRGIVGRSCLTRQLRGRRMQLPHQVSPDNQTTPVQLPPSESSDTSFTQGEKCALMSRSTPCDAHHTRDIESCFQCHSIYSKVASAQSGTAACCFSHKQPGQVLKVTLMKALCSTRKLQDRCFLACAATICPDHRNHTTAQLLTSSAPVTTTLNLPLQTIVNRLSKRILHERLGEAHPVQHQPGGNPLLSSCPALFAIHHLNPSTAR